MAYNSGVSNTAYGSFSSFGPRLASNLMNWQQQLAAKNAAQNAQADPNLDQSLMLGTGEQFPIDNQPMIGTGEQYPMSGANKLYGSGQIDYNDVLDRISGKTGVGRASLLKSL